MSTTITGRLQKPANEFQAGECTGFGVRIGKKFRDPKTKQDDWTNYKAVIFAKSQAQIDFYRSALIENTVVEINCEDQQIEKQEYNGKEYLSINMINANLKAVYTEKQAQPAQQQPPQQQAYQQPPVNQQQPNQRTQPQPAQQAPNGFDDFEDDRIPF